MRQGESSTTIKQNTESKFQDQWQAATPQIRPQLLMEHVRSQVAKVLGQQEAAALSRTTGFFNLGMDSLTSIELRNRLQSSIGIALPATLAFDYPTLETLSEFLSQKLTHLAIPPKQPIQVNRTPVLQQAADERPTEASQSEFLDDEPEEMLDEIAQRLAKQLDFA